MTKIMKLSENPYWEIFEELSKIIPERKFIKKKFLFWEYDLFVRNNWSLHYDLSGLGYLILDLYLPEYEKQFKEICNKYNVHTLYIDDEDE